MGRQCSELVTHLRLLSINAVECIASWRNYLMNFLQTNAAKERQVMIIPYMFKDQNYMIKMRTDTTFIKNSMLKEHFMFSQKLEYKIDPFILSLTEVNESSDKQVQFISKNLRKRIDACILLLNDEFNRVQEDDKYQQMNLKKPSCNRYSSKQTQLLQNLFYIDILPFIKNRQPNAGVPSIRKSSQNNRPIPKQMNFQNAQQNSGFKEPVSPNSSVLNNKRSAQRQRFENSPAKEMNGNSSIEMESNVLQSQQNTVSLIAAKNAQNIQENERENQIPSLTPVRPPNSQISHQNQQKSIYSVYAPFKPNQNISKQRDLLPPRHTHEQSGTSDASKRISVDAQKSSVKREVGKDINKYSQKRNIEVLKINESAKINSNIKIHEAKKINEPAKIKTIKSQEEVTHNTIEIKQTPHVSVHHENTQNALVNGQVQNGNAAADSITGQNYKVNIKHAAASDKIVQDSHSQGEVPNKQANLTKKVKVSSHPIQIIENCGDDGVIYVGEEEEVDLIRFTDIYLKTVEKEIKESVLSETQEIKKRLRVENECGCFQLKKDNDLRGIVYYFNENSQQSRRITLMHISAVDRRTFDVFLTSVIKNIFQRDCCDEIRFCLYHHENQEGKLQVHKDIQTIFTSKGFKWKQVNNDKYTRQRTTILAVRRPADIPVTLTLKQEDHILVQSVACLQKRSPKRHIHHRNMEFDMTVNLLGSVEQAMQEDKEFCQAFSSSENKNYQKNCEQINILMRKLYKYQDMKKDIFDSRNHLDEISKQYEIIYDSSPLDPTQKVFEL